MKAVIKPALLALTIGSQAFAEQKAVQSKFNGKDGICYLFQAATNVIEVRMETNSPVITLGNIPAAQIFESLTDWTSTVTATTTVTTMTTTIMVPRPTAEVPLTPTTNASGRVKPVVEILSIAFGLSWAVTTL
ncbi:uncharacterized protein PgNI_06740 [Pyricularia grisea]|uniref:Uncharacterized protein n=1 Tax=Pyricularia grisea TaxID=148305 RepID=A0A6P8B1J4_PYRGI|nr:uncharacterized protein PgNI_06740 [Pyricularia grisea]TLD08588.1 hypothetical protein PgNI_06740 [Pyricularia grisea]